MKISDIRVTEESGLVRINRPLDRMPDEQNTRTPVRAASMTVKIGLCALAAVLALIIRIAERRNAGENSAVAAAASAEQEGNQEDQLGTLHFVDAGDLSLLGVSKWAAPVASEGVELYRDGQMISFTAASGEVTNCCLGEVRAVETDPELGLSVRIAHGNELETIYYGFDKVLVEKGQVVRAGDTLGTVCVGGTICLSVLKSGAPQDPAAYLDVEIGQ